MLSLADIVTDVYFKLSVNPDNETYKKGTVVIPRINSVMQQILADRKYNVILPNSTYSPDIKWWDLEFLRGNMFFDRIRDTVATNNSNAGEYRVEIKYRNDIQSAWWVYISWMIFKYTLLEEEWKIYMVFETPLEMKVRWWTRIEFLYPISEDAEETYQLFSIANWRETEIVYSDYRYPEDYIIFWSILYKDWTKLIRLNLPDAREYYQFKLNYYKKITDLVEDDDVSLFPEERWDKDVLALLVAWELLRETEKSDDWQKKLIQWYWKLISFYDKFATINKGYRQDMWWNRQMNRHTAIIN